MAKRGASPAEIEAAFCKDVAAHVAKQVVVLSKVGKLSKVGISKVGVSKTPAATMVEAGRPSKVGVPGGKR